MAEFTVPQFIEHEPKIVGPFTFKQFLFIAVAAVIGFILYFTVPFYLFVFLTTLLVLGALALALVKVEGRSLPTILINFFSFLFSSKIYLWKKKTLPPKIIKKQEPVKEKMIEEKSPTLKVAGKSRLKDLSTRIETGIK